MASKPIPSLLFFATTLVLISATVNALFNAESLCKSTKYPKLCKSVMQTVRGHSETAAVEVAIQTSLTKTIEAHALIQKLWATAKPKDKDALDTCRQTYDSAVYDLKKAMASLKRKDKNTLQITLSAVLDDYVTCDDAFGGGGPGGLPVPPPPAVAKVSTPLQQLASNNLLYAAKIHL